MLVNTVGGRWQPERKRSRHGGRPRQQADNFVSARTCVLQVFTCADATLLATAASHRLFRGSFALQTKGFVTKHIWNDDFKLGTKSLVLIILLAPQGLDLSAVQ